MPYYLPVSFICLQHLLFCFCTSSCHSKVILHAFLWLSVAGLHYIFSIKITSRSPISSALNINLLLRGWKNDLKRNLSSVTYIFKLKHHTCNLLSSNRVCKIAKNHVFVMSVCPSAKNNAAPTGRISMKFDIWVFFENLSKRIQVSLRSDNNTGYFTWRLIIFFDHISLSSSQNEKYFRQNCRLWGNVEKYCRSGQPHCMVDTCLQTHTQNV